MALSHQSSVQSFGSVAPGLGQSPTLRTRPYSALPLNNEYDTSLMKSGSSSHKHYSLQGPPSLLHKESLASITTNSAAATNFTFTPGKARNTFRISQIDLHRQATDKNLKKSQLKQLQKSQQKKTLPLFPTERTRGVTSVQNTVKPGLKHKHLFRMPFYSPSVESALSTMLNAKRKSLFSVKMMRMDTVGGLLTTVISRTFPPLIPQEFHELFQKPNGLFCFELLEMLPELNRFLFVEILNLCCDLGDNQLYNLVSCSKLSVYPGSCCFGLDEYMPTWDTRYLLSSNVTRKSEAFYQVICGYRDERDLSAEELKQKQVRRDRILEEERLEILENLYGLEGTHNILRRESRIAQGLPPDSPELPELPDDMKEVSLYADRREIVVADDNISVLDIQLDDEEDSPKKPERKRKNNSSSAATNEEENVENVMADLRKSVSMAIIESRATTTLAAVISYKSLYRSSPYSNRKLTTQRPKLARTKTLARFSSIDQNIYPVSPGDIFGISRHAIEQRELQGFLSVARTNKKQHKSAITKRIKQRRIQSKLLQKSAHPRVASIMPRIRNLHSSQRHFQQSALQAKINFTKPQSLRRERTRQLRKDIEVYLSRGLSAEEAMEQRKVDLKKKKRNEKRAKAAALAHAEADAKAELEKESARIHKEVTMEEAEILEAFDYLTDVEFEEFLSLAGLTMQDVEKIREKDAAAALKQVTEDIQSIDRTKPAASVAQLTQKPEPVVPSAPAPKMKEPEVIPIINSFGDAFNSKLESDNTSQQKSKSRPTSISHMTSMDLLIKNANIIGDSNLRCYPIPPSAPVTVEKSIQQIIEPRVPEPIVTKEAVKETVVVTIQVTVEKDTGDEQQITPVSKAEAQIEPSRERTSEDSTLSSAETVVEPEPTKEVQPTLELIKEKPLPQVQAKVQKDLPEPVKEKELPQIQTKVEKELPKIVVENSKQPQTQAKIQKELPKLKAEKEQGESKPVAKSVKQNIMKFEQTVQPKQKENTQINSIRAKANMFNKQASTPAPTSAPAPGRLRSSFLTPATSLTSKVTSSPSPSQTTMPGAFPKDSNSNQIQSTLQKSKLAAPKVQEPTPSSKARTSTPAQPAATPSKQATPIQTQTSTPISKLPSPTTLLISKIPSAALASPGQQSSVNSTSTSGSSRIPVSNRSSTTTLNSSRPASPRAPSPDSNPTNKQATSFTSLPKPSSSIPVPAPSPNKANRRAESPISMRVMEITSVYTSQSDNDSTATLQMLDVESGDEDEKFSSVQIKTLAVKEVVVVENDDEATELRELLESMTKEERQEYLRLSI
ncbi:hypothetical protein BGZ76_010678 [Entomortierella beljakovae]|nr:hypothetical protein BGZ76_010678 [Entomortierella beljakovae]